MLCLELYQVGLNGYVETADCDAYLQTRSNTIKMQCLTLSSKAKRKWPSQANASSSPKRTVSATTSGIREH